MTLFLKKSNQILSQTLLSYTNLLLTEIELNFLSKVLYLNLTKEKMIKRRDHTVSDQSDFSIEINYQ